ncbi:DUF742 domain-containing protein [Streptantibioticus rubrisoli]|uniref:DUF742 domain-containing protein n=1 Tax=Streptantibioticus rubrisoli TaxID=1387313 RepID=A0ABT1P566_9ACTN|nr:DUF742 domain-containing protein [Streptantibioticus rubrisoli]MCQ4040511.1 DUF742 domain-containing protein [Streptantibioticus rubrisoli]
MSTGGDPSWGTPGKDEGGEDDHTFADVLNAFSFDNARRRRKKSRPSGAPGEAASREGRESPPPAPTPAFPTAPADDEQQPGTWRHEPQPSIWDSGQWESGQGEKQESASIVRAYAWTGGRTRSHYDFQIETLVTTTELGHRSADATQADHQAVIVLCSEPRSVAEIAALLSVPLGVAKVILSDMAEHGLISVHQTATENGDVPDRTLLERVLSGLRRL